MNADFIDDMNRRIFALTSDVRSLQAAVDDLLAKSINDDLVLETVPSRTDPSGEPQSTDQSPDYNEGYRDGYRDGPGAACICGAEHPLRLVQDRTSSVEIGTPSKGGGKFYFDAAFPKEAAEQLANWWIIRDMMYSEYTTRQENHHKPTVRQTPEAPA
jgi:hypothetical protein